MRFSSTYYLKELPLILLMMSGSYLYAQNTTEDVKIRILSKTVFHQGNDSTAFLNEHMNWGDTKSNISNGYLTSTWGRNNIASENQATAWGNGNQATSWNTTAFGNSTRAIASHATSWGAFTEASGIYSTASGKDTKVSGAYSMAWGIANEVSGGSSAGWGSGNVLSGGGGATWGLQNNVSGQTSTSWGRKNTVTGDTATVWGSNNQVTGTHASVWGTMNTNQGRLSTVWGSDNHTNSYLSTVHGRFNVIREETPNGWKESETLFQLGNGNEDERRDAIVVLKDGSVGINFGAEDGIPKEKLEVYGSIRSSETVVGEKLIANSNIGIGTGNPSEELVIKTTQDTSHLVIQSTGNSSLVDLKGLNQSAIRFFETDQEVAQFKWTGANLEIFSNPPTVFPVLRLPILKMTPDNKLSINPGLSTPIEVLEIGGRLKLGYNDLVAAPGVMRFNSSVKAFEGYNGSEWLNFTGQLMDDDGDSQITFVEDTVDSIKFTVNSGEEMSFNGHSLTLGKNGNTFIGYHTSSFESNFNTGNTSLGWQSTPYILSGTSNLNLGFWTGHNLTSGDFNTNVGAYANFKNQDGSTNTAIGYYAGYNNVGSGNVFLGHMAGRFETGDNKLYIDNSDTESPLIYGNFDLDLLQINGSLFLPSLKPSVPLAQNLELDHNGKVIAVPKPSTLTFHSGDFHDWVGNVGAIEIAVGLNNYLENGDDLSLLSATVIPFNPIIQQGMDIKLLIRNLSTGQYFTLLRVSDNNIPTSATTYSDDVVTPFIVDKDNFEYLLVSDKSASQIIKVTIE